MAKIGPETITIHNNCISGDTLLKLEFLAIMIRSAQNSAAKNAKISPIKFGEFKIKLILKFVTDKTTPIKAKINPRNFKNDIFSLFFVNKSNIVNHNGIE